MKSFFYLLISFTLFLVSCNERAENVISSKESLEGGFQKSSLENSDQSSIPKVESRKLIWTANMTFQVKDVQKSSSAIRLLCDKHDAFIADMRMTSNNYRISNTLTIRVPNKQFNQLLESVKGESIFLDEASVNSNDVTEEYIDIESRLKTKREVRDRYIAILNTKTGSVKDIIEAEEAIRVITEEIEAKEGRLRYLQDQVSLSTITLELYQKVDYVAQPTIYEKPFSEEISDSFSSGWSFIQNFFLSLITIWPLLVLLIAVGFWQRKRIKAIIRLTRE